MTKTSPWFEVRAEEYIPPDEKLGTCVLKAGVERMEKDPFETRRFRIRVKKLREKPGVLTAIYDNDACMLICKMMLAHYPDAEEEGFIVFTVNVYLNYRGKAGSVRCFFAETTGPSLYKALTGSEFKPD